jgi:hypothetical protein
MRRAQIAFDKAGYDTDSPEAKLQRSTFLSAPKRLRNFKPRTVADVAAKLRGVELSYAGKRGEIKRLAVKQGCFIDQALAIVLTDVERLAKGGAS